MKLNVIQEDLRAKAVAQGIDERLVGRTATTADLEFELWNAIALLQQDESLDQNVQPFFTAHAREIAEGWHIGNSGLLVSLQIDAVVNDANAIGGQSEAAAHEFAEVMSGRDEQVHVPGAFGERAPGDFPVFIR